MMAELATLARQHWAQNYRMDIRAVVRGLWSGVLTYFQAWEQMDLAIRRGLPLAWQDGSEECGIMPSDWTPQERQALESAIARELGYVDGFLTAIEEGSKANGGKLGPLMGRADVWVTRYLDVRNQAMLMSCKDKKLVWRLDCLRMSKEHCRDCLRLAGRVHRASVWAQYDIRPQHRKLACGGWRCACCFEETDAPARPGRPPSLSG